MTEKFRNLDSNGDWTFGSGLNNYARNKEAVKLDVRTRILSWKNDCFFDMNVGIDWINRFDFNQRKLLEEEIKTVILQTSGVARLNSFDTSFTDRTLSVSYNITTIYSSEFQDEIEVL